MPRDRSTKGRRQPTADTAAPPVGISIREFARRDGCSATLVHRAIRAGHLQPLVDGKMDPALVGTGWRKTNRRAAPGGRQAPSPDTADDIHDDELQIDAEQIKSAVLVLRHLLASRDLADELADVEEICGPFVEEVLRARDALLVLPSRVGPSIAAELGVSIERMVEVLSVYVRQQITELGEPQPDFSV